MKLSVAHWLNWGACLAFLAGVTLQAAEPSSGKAALTFNADVRPILSDKCFACHGFDAKKRKAGLRLDLAESAFSTNKEGRVAIKPRDLAHSELWRRLNTTDIDDVMPPPDTHKQISAAEKSVIQRWIEQGAPYQKHWAFEAPVKYAVPAVQEANWARTPIDHFIAARLEKEGLKPAGEAEKTTLLRRVTFDLTGLPPTPAELANFLADRDSGAYERVVDRLLNSPRYGEHMAKYWLDVARYADTHGLHLDNERQTWAFRDWVVRAFNRNLSFDEFTIEQLAGDLLQNPTLEQLTATGFNRCNVTTSEGGAIDDEFIFRYAVDRTATTVQAWMGLTAGCAVCHDHKYDPISAKEFYSLYDFFHSAADPAMDGNAILTAPTVKLRTPDQEKQLADLDAKRKQAEANVTEAVAKVSYIDPASMTPLPTPKTEETVWMDDDFPAGANLVAAGEPLMWITAKDGPVYSGKRAIRRKEPAVGQDVSEGGSLSIPGHAMLFAYVYIDTTNRPRSVMLQYNKDGWEHRAVWGDADAIGWGTKDSPSRFAMGPLPKTGEWVRLEVPAEKVGLKTGDKLAGFAITQHGGTVYWDKVGVAGTVDPAHEPLHSFAVWTGQYEGKEPGEVPEALRKIFKNTNPTNRTPEQVQHLRNHYLAQVCAETRPTFDPLNARVAELRRQREELENSIPGTFIWRDMEKPRDSFIMVRGQYDKKGEKVVRSVPAVFPQIKTTGTPNRLDFARWLVSPEHPLTARVTVNRFWQQFFGIGLVKSADDFGSQGTPPSHPELLDWLAVNFRESGWDIKELVKLIVTSSTYRQSSKVTQELWQRDPENRLLARGPRFRLDAEEIRDNALFVSGLLDAQMGGKGVRTYQPPNIWEPVAYSGSNTREYKQDMGSALYRRTVYSFLKRTAPPPFMSTFDAPNREQFCTRRERSDTPLQALQLLNDVQHFEAARQLAERMMTEGGSTPEQRIDFGYRTVLSRRPTLDEVNLVKQTLEKHLARYKADESAAKEAISFGESKPMAGLAPTELAAYTLTANLLLNLDETITRN